MNIYEFAKKAGQKTLERINYYEQDAMGSLENQLGRDLTEEEEEEFIEGFWNGIV